jgi:hypothetical protein
MSLIEERGKRALAESVSLLKNGIARVPWRTAFWLKLYKYSLRWKLRRAERPGG